MTNQPTDPIDPYEGELARRVGAFADRAVEPIDAGAIAHAANLADRRRTSAGRLLAPGTSGRQLAIFGAAALVGVLAVGVIGVGWRGLFSPSQTAGANPGATPTSVPEGTRATACQVANLDARIHDWSGAAGSRIATVVVQNTGSAACSLPTLGEPALVDATGRVLLDGRFSGSSESLTLRAGDWASTLVEASNYCGDPPSQPVTIWIKFADGSLLMVRPAGGSASLDAVPPCNGPSDGRSIQMQPFKPGPVS